MSKRTKCSHAGIFTFSERVNGWRYVSYTPGVGMEELNNDATRYTLPKNGKCEDCGKTVPLPPEVR